MRTETSRLAETSANDHETRQLTPRKAPQPLRPAALVKPRGTSACLRNLLVDETARAVLTQSSDYIVLGVSSGSRGPVAL